MTDSTGGAAPVYEADDRTYDHRVGGRWRFSISGTQTEAVGARDLRRGRRRIDVSSNHRRRAAWARAAREFFGTRGAARRVITGKSMRRRPLRRASSAAPARC